MAVSSHKHKAQALILILTAVVVAYSSASGPEARYTGAPGDLNSCVQCHDTYHDANVGPGAVQVDNNPGVYTPGQDYTLVVTVQQANRQRYGFQLTAIDGDGNRAGTLTTLASDTQVNTETGLGGRQYIQHSQSGTLPSASDRRVWQVSWTAPANDVGTVRFYVAGNAANGNGNNQLDYIYTNAALSESPSSVVSVSLLSQLDGQTLAAGSPYTISWSATNTGNVDSYELRYSTDDGMTFPITNLIYSTVDADATSYQWTVPNTPTSQARLRLQAATKSGTAIEVKSGRFTISGSATSVIPAIATAWIDGKALFVTGDGFQQGAKVELNGEDQKTANLEDFSHQLKCKKAGKWIAPGSTVTLVVRNPDGARSEPFSFTRPSG